MLKKFGYQIRREYICNVSILGKDLCKSHFDYQTGYLRSTERVDIYIKQGKAYKCDKLRDAT